MQGGDKMACTSQCYSNKINRLCRKCNVKGKDSGNPYIHCQKIKMNDIKKLVDENKTEKLKNYINIMYRMLGLMLILGVIHMEYSVLLVQLSHYML